MNLSRIDGEGSYYESEYPHFGWRIGGVTFHTSEEETKEKMTKDKAKSTMSLSFDASNTALASLCGPTDQNIRELASQLGIEIRRRGSVFTLTGEKFMIEQAASNLETLLRQVEKTGKSLDVTDIQWLFVGQGDHKTRHSISEEDDGRGTVDLKTRRRDLQGRTTNQRLYLNSILSHDISFGIGPAGTGKTYLAVATAVDAFERGSVERIVLTRPAVEAGERLGFLPGDLTQKVDPYLRPLYDALFDLMGFEKSQRLMERQLIEVAPLAYMRGRTLNNAFIILDEAQNTTPEQMKMFLTRIGFGSKAVITGDITQIDLPRGVPSGLKHAAKILENVRGISITRFTAADVVRHPLVARIVQAYEAQENADATNAKTQG